MKFRVMITILLFHTTLMAKTGDTHCYESATYANINIVQTITEKDKGKSLYEFGIDSLEDSVGPIHGVRLVSTEQLDNVGGPINWNAAIHKLTKENAIWIGWSGHQYNLKPGHSLSGFKFEGSSRRGLVPLKILNHYSGRTRRAAKLTDILRPKDSVCPGEWAAGSTTNGDNQLRAMILAPIPENRVSPAILIKKENHKLWTGTLDQQTDLTSLSPLDTGRVKLLIEGSNEFNVKDIDLDSLEFARGKAKALSHKFVNHKSMGAMHPQVKSFAKTRNALELDFDLSKLNIVCELDHALFLSGKLKNGKELFSGVKIKPVKCTTQTFAKEAVGIYRIIQELEKSEHRE